LELVLHASSDASGEDKDTSGGDSPIPVDYSNQAVARVIAGSSKPTSTLPANSNQNKDQVTPIACKSASKAKELRNPMEKLLERQVELLETQVKIMKSIETEMKRRTVIQEELLQLKKRKYSYE